MSLVAAITLGITAPFVSHLSDPPVSVPDAPLPIEATDQSASPVHSTAPSVPVSVLSDDALRPAQAMKGATPRGALTDVVSEAIKRKLERVNQGRASGRAIETPARIGGYAPAVPVYSPTAGNFIAPAPIDVDHPDTAPVAPENPDLEMLSPGSTVILGGSAASAGSFIRVVPDASATLESSAPAAHAVHTPPDVDANPLAISTDRMEVGTDNDAAASQPGPQHNLLDLFVGTWDVTANFDTGPGQPPETASGQMVNSWQLDGRWLKQEYSGRMSTLGGFRGVGYLGFDNLQRTFVSTWMDTLSTSCIVSKGVYDQGKQTFTLGGEFAAPGGAKLSQRQVMTILSPDRYIVTMYLTGPDGVEFKTGNLEYTRSVRTVTNASGR